MIFGIAWLVFIPVVLWDVMEPYTNVLGVGTLVLVAVGGHHRTTGAGSAGFAGGGRRVAKVLRRLPGLLTGFVLGAVVMCVVFVVTTRRPPPTPALPPATAIKVTLHPWHGIGGIDGKPVDIPPDKLDLAFRLLTPAAHFGGGVHEFITPVVAEAVVTHADGTETLLLVRDNGKNPAVVTVDGRAYFYARNDPDVHAGASQLVGLVLDVSRTRKALR